MPPIHDRPRLALAGAISLPVGCLAIVIGFGDVPMCHRRSLDTPGTRAAIALRDDVIDFQKWGTRLFTVPALEGAYDEAVYLVEDRPGQQRAAFADELSRLLATHDEVDVFLLAHGNDYWHWAQAIDPALRRKLRLVYNTGCAGAAQAPQWIDLGADTYVGHPASHSLSPMFYFYFLRRWVNGYPLDEAVADANARAVARARWSGHPEPHFEPTAVIGGDASLWIGSTSLSW